jgi:N utilization substance protein B
MIDKDTTSEAPLSSFHFRLQKARLIEMGRRRRSREIALQILYQLDVTEATPEEGISLYYELFSDKSDDRREGRPPAAVCAFAESIVQGVFLHRSELDRLIVSASEHWRLERMSLVDRNILRIALYEMVYYPNIPPKVSINEAIELGKTFGSEDSGKFINGILDHILIDMRGRGLIPQQQP